MPRVDPEPFWSTVDRSAGPGGCWPWKGAKTADGYGVVYADGLTTRTHRVAWQLAGLPLRSGMTLDHVCRTRACCNPWHLTQLSRAEHARRGRARGRFDVLAPAPILDQHARRVAAYLDERGATEVAILAERLEVPATRSAQATSRGARADRSEHCCSVSRYRREPRRRRTQGAGRALGRRRNARRA